EEAELERRVTQWIGQCNAGVGPPGGTMVPDLLALRWTAVQLINYCLYLLGADITFIDSVSESIRSDNPPFFDSPVSDEEMIQTFHHMAQTGSVGPSYLKNMAPYQQWLARQEPPDAEFPVSSDIDMESFTPQQRTQFYDIYDNVFRAWQT